MGPGSELGRADLHPGGRPVLPAPACPPVISVTTHGLQEATLLVLTALSRGSQHGYGIIADVQQIYGGRGKLRAGTLYSALDRLRCNPGGGGPGGPRTPRRHGAAVM